MFKQTASFLIYLLIALSASSQQKIRFEINSLPANEPANSSIFIAGSFNSWNPQNKDFQFQKNEKGYFLELSLSTGSYEYKITRGGWDKVECTKEGKDVGNRTLKVDADAKVEISVEGWKDLFAIFISAEKKVQPNKNVSIIDTAFFIPQLNRTEEFGSICRQHIIAQRKSIPYYTCMTGKMFLMTRLLFLENGE
jgi:alpha-glucosidase